jgi:hypothetical protein
MIAQRAASSTGEETSIIRMIAKALARDECTSLTDYSTILLPIHANKVCRVVPPDAQSTTTLNTQRCLLLLPMRLAEPLDPRCH